MKVFDSKGSNELYSQWRDLSKDFIELAELVKKPKQVSQKELSNWMDDVSRFMMKVRELNRETFDFITTQRIEMVEEQV